MKFQKISLITFAFTLFMTSCFAQEKTEINSSSHAIENHTDSVSYAFGVTIGEGFKEQGFDNVNLDLLLKAIQDVQEGNPQMESTVAKKVLQDYMQQGQAKEAESNLEAGKSFLEANQKKEDVKTTASGLQYKILEKGDGKVTPSLSDKVQIHYHGMLIDGTPFDSSVMRGKPENLVIEQTLEGMKEALQLMKAGDKFKIYLPPHLGYGELGQPGLIEPNTVLIFEMQLFEIL